MELVRQGNWAAACQNYGTFIDQINNSLQSRAYPQDWAYSKQAIVATLSQWSQKSSQVLSPGDPRALFILKLKEAQGQDSAIACLSVFVRSKIALSGTGEIPAQFICGFWEAFLYERGITDPTPYQASVLSNFITNQTNIFSKEKTAFETTNTELQSRLDQSKKEAIEIRERADEQASEFHDALESSKKRMKDFEDIYNAKLALLAPVT